MLRPIQLIVGLILLISLEILKVYFIMPFPGSQHWESVEFAYFLHTNIFYFRTIGWLIILFPAFYFLWQGSTKAKILTAIGLLLYGSIFYMFNFRFLADKMFYQPEQKIFAEAASNKIEKKNLIIGVSQGGESKAYPVELIGYHHQVRDTLGGKAIMVTYCTVCRTGRVFVPLVNGKPETFRLVGMDHFNAMFEDATTQSWWRQVNGEAVAGPLKGNILEEIPSEQMTLRAWLEQHPDSKIMQPDTTFAEQYEHLKDFDEGTKASSLEGRDSLSWKEKSWVVGVQLGNVPRAYDWNNLVAEHAINDTLAATPILIAIESDSATFHVWERDSLAFAFDSTKDKLVDLQTRSTWNWQGKAIEGPMKDHQLKVVQSYQEFWHSWRTFRPHTTVYESDKPKINSN
jgi:hypothetical protein